MTILIDFSQVAICGIQKGVASSRINVLTKDICRHLILNSIRQITHKFKRDYGNVVICCDSKNYWRKNYFPFYKITRKKKREKSDLDWPMIFETMTELKEMFKTQSSYKVLEIDGAEADDIIGLLSVRLAAHEKVLIVSSDSDYKQNHKYSNIKQYTPQLEVFVTCEDPVLWLKQKIISGDPKDSVPSCISNDNVFAEGIRQKPVTKKIKEYYLSADFNDPTINNYRNIIRNRTLLDFEYIPSELKEKIVEEYEIEQTGSKSDMMKYMIKHNLKLLLECLDEF